MSAPSTTHPRPDYPACLVRQADELQREAREVLSQLDLEAHFAPVGELLPIGSAATGLLVWRDVDFNVFAPGLTTDRVFECLQTIARQASVTQLRFLNETGARNPTGSPCDERFFVAINFVLRPDAVWKIDFSFWLQRTAQEEVDAVANIRGRLTPESRLAILWIKDIWHRLPVYRREVTSMDIYEAVLGENVRTPEEFDRWLAAHGKPVRKS